MQAAIPASNQSPEQRDSTTPRNRVRTDASRRVMWILLTSGIVVLSIKYMTEYGVLNRIAQQLGGTKPLPAAAPEASDYTTTERLKQMMIAMGVRIYGSDSCPWSRKQIQDLSIDPNDTRLFVDCEKRPSEATAIEAYPSWKTKKGKVMVGYMDASKAIAALQAELYEIYDKAPAETEQQAPPKKKAPQKNSADNNVVEVLDSDDDDAEAAKPERSVSPQKKAAADLSKVKQEDAAPSEKKPKPEKPRTLNLGAVAAPAAAVPPPVARIAGDTAAAALSAGAVEAVSKGSSGTLKK